MNLSVKKLPFLLVLIFFFAADCPDQESLFEEIPSRKSKINFANQLDENEETNILTYEYFYNGGGIAVGDINNDGLEDIFFTANMEENRLYLNQGGMKFRDITSSAGLAGKSDAWTTGTTMVDINGDGWLDIYVCYSGEGKTDLRKNELYINNQDNTFMERSAEYGLDDPSHSTQAAFIDFDRDGDLDMYLLNHNITVINDLEFDQVRFTRHEYAGDKFYINQGDHFEEITEKTGIKSSPLGFGLGVAISDVNMDGWPDIYVSNDYIEPDYLYINNGDGTFTDQLQDYFQHISHFSMGSDINDINNDGLPDIFTLDMLPEDNKRQKLLYGPENYEQYALMVNKGFYHQNMRNMLHLNNANGTFSEIGQLAGVSNTDWSWSSLLADFDNDGWKDLFVTNGYYRDYTNRDFLKYKGDYYFQKAVNQEQADTFHLVTSMTSTPVHNYLYRNLGDLSFEDKSECWGFDQPNFSNGSVYSDLDNDGDLDLVVNNLNEKASLYENRANELNQRNNFIKLTLKGTEKNSFGLGTKVYLYSGGETQYFEQSPVRGFQSSVSPVIHFGLGARSTIDSLVAIWPDGTKTKEVEVGINQTLELQQTQAISFDDVESETSTFFLATDSPVKYIHREYNFNDFKRQPMLMTMMTTCGPVMEVADLNQDGLDDVYVGGAKGSRGQLYLQQQDGSFKSKNLTEEKINLGCTDCDVKFIDFDQDGDLDIYLASGGYQDYDKNDPYLQDRLFFNDGQGNFEYDQEALPAFTGSKSCVRVADFEGDGDPDLFVGGRVVPGEFPVSPSSYILINNGKGKFSNATAQIAPFLTDFGMVTDAAWTDINKDGFDDLIVVGEFMPVTILINQNGQQLADRSSDYFNQPLKGLWTKITASDFDGDGDDDFIVGNFGENSQLKTKEGKPLELYYSDFDENGSIDPVLNCYILGEPYPFASRDEMLNQIYALRQKFTTYEAYSEAQINDIFSNSELKNAQKLEANYLKSIYLKNENGELLPRPLPTEAQFSPVYAIHPFDYNQDGNLDFILAGNQSAIRIRLGVMDSNYGQLYLGDGEGNFDYVPQRRSGLKLKGDVKSLRTIKIKDQVYLIAGINRKGIDAYKLEPLH